MGTSEDRPTRGQAIARWVGIQVAAKAVSLGLGTPLVTGAVMGALAYAQGLPLALGFLCVVLASAGASTMLNQARSFMLAYSVQGKFVLKGAFGERGQSGDGSQGYA